MLLSPILAFIPPKKGVVVITLHNIPSRDHLWFELFVKNMSKYYEFINPFQMDTEFLDINNNTKILLSFDDGFKSNRILAENILAKLDIKGLFFITEDFIGQQKSIAFMNKTFYPNSPRKSLNREETTPMSWEDVQWLVDNGHMIGAHTKSHPVLSSLQNIEKLSSEIIISANRLETSLNTKINCFAFPFGTIGSIDENSLILAKTRFDYVFSNIRGCVTDSPSRGFIFRQNIVPGDSMMLNRKIIDGRLDWKYRQARRQAVQLLSSKS
jgi:peptidoglycan/xylan/chitin deacetylase (PgdA/CDA1 family)